MALEQCLHFGSIIIIISDLIPPVDKSMDSSDMKPFIEFC
jgi:hypothetical protein